jgi:prephenate dehydrogenase
MAGPRRALIVGLGLIGGSLGMAARARGWRIGFLDPAVDEAAARRCGAADRKVEQIENADLVVLATPVDVALRLLEQLPAAQLTTSVCSVMGPLSTAARRRGLRFTAGHPLAGSQRRTLAAARADLFTGVRWFLESGDEPLLGSLVADCGATADVVDPFEHDRAVAMTSHLPQVLSTSLAASIEAAGIDVRRFGASGLATFLRLAGSDPSVWTPILEANRENLVTSLDEVIRRARRIAQEPSPEEFDAAHELWRRLDPERKPG